MSDSCFKEKSIRVYGYGNRSVCYRKATTRCCLSTDPNTSPCLPCPLAIVVHRPPTFSSWEAEAANVNSKGRPLESNRQSGPGAAGLREPINVRADSLTGRLAARRGTAYGGSLAGAGSLMEWKCHEGKVWSSSASGPPLPTLSRFSANLC